MGDAEGKTIASEWLQELEGWGWDPLSDLAESRIDKVVQGPSGLRYRLRAYTFWDMEEWASDLYIKVRVDPPAGWRRLWGYRLTGIKPGEELPRDRP